jgi:hypothetical protein
MDLLTQMDLIITQIAEAITITIQLLMVMAGIQDFTVDMVAAGEAMVGIAAGMVVMAVAGVVMAAAGVVMVVVSMAVVMVVAMVVVVNKLSLRNYSGGVF